MEQTFQIPVENIATLTRALDKLAKRAAKCGQVIAYTVAPKSSVVSVVRVDAKGGTSFVDAQVVAVTVTGDAPGFDGWKLVGDLNWTDGITTRRMIDQSREMPARAIAVEPHTCEHCALNRNRSTGWVVEHVDGTVKVVGSTCLSDFTGHPSPQGLASMAEMLFAARELCEEFEGAVGGKRYGWNALDFAFAAVAAVQYQGGYVKAGRDDGVTPTSVVAELVADARCGIGRESIGTEALAAANADTVRLTFEALRWLSEQSDQASDWIYNLRTIYASGWVSVKRAGIAASFVAGFFRELEQRAEQAIPSAHVGKVKERRSFGKARVVRVYESAGDYGMTWFVTLRIEEGPEAGAVLVWTSSRPFEPSRGDLVMIEKATVKAHRAYKGQPQTVITRAVVSPVAA